MGNLNKNKHLLPKFTNSHMNTFTKTLISTAAALLISQSEAKAIHNSCLVLSDQTAGHETGEFITNEDQLTGSSVTGDMRVHSIKTCHADGNVTGLQFFMALDPYETLGDAGEEFIEMAPIGSMTGQCDWLELPEGLDKIKATLAPGATAVSIKYRIVDGPNEMTTAYGDLDQNNKIIWSFDDANPLVGLYGRQTEAGISQLGFITLDTACQAAAEEVVEPVEPTIPEQPTGLEQVNTEKTTDKDVLLGLPLVTLILIVVGVIVGITLIVASLCTLKHRKSQQNRVATPEATAVKRRSGQKPREVMPAVADTDVENNGTPAAAFASGSKLAGAGATTDKV